VGGPAKRRERRDEWKRFTAGRFAGIEVRLHWSMLAVFV
jgi:hypothetical protein